MNNETLRLIFEKNPGLFNILLTGVLLPMGILWLTNRHNRKQRESEKSLESKYNSKINLRKQERIVYASLLKILFEVQQLYISLEGKIVSANVIINALGKFEESVYRYHGDISNNMLYLSSSSINLIYKFYQQMSNLRIELMKLSENTEYDMATIVLFDSSQLMANSIIEIQEMFMKERPELKVQFNKTQQDEMKNLCGLPPSKEKREKYEKQKQSLLSHGLQ